MLWIAVDDGGGRGRPTLRFAYVRSAIRVSPRSLRTPSVSASVLSTATT